jgi:O-antigen/teichoic acid export membrane protein
VFSVAALNVTLNLVLITRYGWRGAVIATLISDAALAFLLAACVVKLSNSEKPEPQDQESSLSPVIWAIFLLLHRQPGLK